MMDVELDFGDVKEVRVKLYPTKRSSDSFTRNVGSGSNCM
jgi:hypothetical protein